MSASHKGVPLPDAVKAKLADGRKAGANHWNWAGGKSEDKHANSKRYYTWKLAVHKRDMNICVDCGKTDLRGRDRQADHIEPWSENRARRFDVSNGRTLCHPCHAKRSAQQSRERNQRRKAA